MKAPKAFVSYSHDSVDHKSWVLRLATDLRANGVDATIDQWDLAPGQDIVAFMQHGISTSDRVVLVCSEPYVTKAEAGVGGVGYERLIVTAELVQSIDTKKFIPVVRANGSARKTPNFLGPRLYVDFTADPDYAAKLEELLREIHGAPSLAKTPLGPNPFSRAVPAAASTTRPTASPTGRTLDGKALLDEAWFEEQAQIARAGIGKLGMTGEMEIRFGIHEGLAKSQIELLNAVRSSEIQTFGWPIAVLLENREDFRPRPVASGIRAEVAIANGSLSGRSSYDYWAIRSTGDFFLLQSLFEDQRSERRIFFNTRIVRVTEALMFASSLYENLGAPAETRLSVRFAHRGLAGRELTSSTSNRHLLPAPASENEAQTELVIPLGEIRSGLVQHVQRITSPMFMLFNFMEIPDSVYRDIVTRFEKGEVT